MEDQEKQKRNKYKAGPKQRELIDRLRSVEGAYLRRYHDGDHVRNWTGRPGAGETQIRFSNRFVEAMIAAGVLVRVPDETPADLAGKNGRFVLSDAWKVADPTPPKRERERKRKAEPAAAGAA